MNNEAIRQSRVLDDGAGTLNRADPVHRVHEALQSAASSRMHTAPAGLRARVVSEVRSGGRPHAESTARWWALAASLAMVGGLAVWAPWRSFPTTQVAATEAPPDIAPPARFAVASITELPALTAPTIQRSMQEPLLREARAIRADTERAAASIFSHFPIPGGARGTPDASPASSSSGVTTDRPLR
jgi:hypothetical protein